MFGIYLTTLQKLEVALICVILGIAGVLVFMSMRPQFNWTITTFEIKRQHPVSDNATHDAKITADNPRDPKKDENVTIFACQDGQLEIVEYPNNPARHLSFKWKPERRQPGLVYQYYQDPMTPVEKIKDPFRHALAYATYNSVYATAKKLLGSAGLTAEQLLKEDDTRKQMMNEIQIINASSDAGTYQPKLMDAVVKALKAYNDLPGDPQKDKPKANLAHKVMEAVTAYLDQMQADTDKSIDKYMDTMDKLLTADQKQRLIDAYKVSTQPAVRGGAAGRRGGAAGAMAPARGGAATTPGRGGAAAAPARGGAATTPARGGGARGTTVPAGG